jgi:hypothetical protein
MSEDLFLEILKLLKRLPSREEQLSNLGAVFLSVSLEELERAWLDGEFKEVQTRQLRMLDNMRKCLSGEPDLELLKYKVEAERAIDESDWDELGRLRQEFRRRLEEG